MSRPKPITQRLLSVLSSAALAASCMAAACGEMPVTTAHALETGQVANPIIWADVPDPDIIRVGDTYYMVSTTMYFSPGVPVMKSKDLVSWEICSYVYDTMADGAKQTLSNGQHDYSHGSWAASLRYHKGTFYVFFGSYGTNKSYIYKTNDIESVSWTKSEISGMYHDASILFDDDGRNYLVYGGDGNIKIKELNSQMTGFAYGAQERTIIRTGFSGLAGEGAHVQKINGWYYVFLIAWPSGSKRIELCYRSKSLTGTFEGKTVLDSGLGTYGSGVAQGGIVDTPDGDWYGLLFQDHGAVGRIPVLVPVTWQNDWPIMGVNGKAPVVLDIPGDHKGTQLAVDDEFVYSNNKLKPEWQWNHNPDNRYWSLTERPGWLRLKNGYTAKSIMNARNTLTMRTEGPSCSGIIKMDVSNMKPGDYAGLSAFQYNYGNVGVRITDSGEKKIYMATNGNYGGNDVMNSADKIQEEVSFSGSTVFLKTEFQFNTVDGNYNVSNNIDKVNFYYSLDGISWKKIGSQLSMTYDLKLFTGYRNAIFSYATKSTGGFVDVDYFDYECAEWNPPSVVEPDADGYLLHDTFENGIGKWSARGGCTAAISTDSKYSGSYSLSLSERTAAWNGGMRSLSTNIFVPGKSYAFSACFINQEGPDTAEFKLTLQYDLNGQTNYDKIAQETGDRGKYVQLYNSSYTIPSGATNLVLVAETTEENCDFYIDEVIAAPAGTKIDAPSASVSQGNTSGTETSSYIFHDTFENGTDDWSARGGCTAAASSSAKYKGSKSLSLSGRSGAWNGGQKSLSTSAFVPGKSYTFSACFANLEGSDTTEFKLTLQYDLNGETKYDKIAQTYADRGKFVQLYNPSYTIPSGAENLVLVAETTQELCDFYIDEIIAAPTGTKINRSAAPVTGDVDLDGNITIKDLIELKKGMIRGINNSAAKYNADIDRSGAVDENDEALLRSYLLGEIKGFPVINTHLSMKDFTAKVQNGIVEKEPDSANSSKNGVAYGEILKKSYYSTTCNRQKDVNILLPPNYDPNKQYPVMYILHGYYEGIDRMLTKGNADMHTREMIGNAIAEGAAKEMICVFPDVFSSPTLRSCTGMDETNNQAYDNFINDLTKDLMPYIAKNFSIKTGKDNTAITGFSMGGRESLLIGMKRPDLFGYIGAICPAPGVSGSFRWIGDDQPYFLMITAGSDDKTVYDNPKNYHSSFEKNGVPHIWHYVNGGYHGDNCIRAHLYNFFRIAFKN